MRKKVLMRPRGRGRRGYSSTGERLLRVDLVTDRWRTTRLPVKDYTEKLDQVRDI